MKSRAVWTVVAWTGWMWRYAHAPLSPPQSLPSPSLALHLPSVAAPLLKWHLAPQPMSSVSWPWWAMRNHSSAHAHSQCNNGFTAHYNTSVYFMHKRILRKYNTRQYHFAFIIVEDVTHENTRANDQHYTVLRKKQKEFVLHATSRIIYTNLTITHNFTLYEFVYVIAKSNFLKTFPTFLFLKGLILY